ncbi:peptide chain release factor 2 [Pelagibacteraceae bacterium]|nr:peptide chain release factor 2 [Pelagibacteraceae bacterium]
MIDEKNILEIVEKSLKNIRGYLDQNLLDQKLKELEENISLPNFWDDNQKAQSILKEKNSIEKIVLDYKKQLQIFEDLKDFVSSLEKEFDDDLYSELKKTLQKLSHSIKSLEANCYLSGDADKFDCYLEVHAGAGGTESQDWADMIRKMYLKWSENTDRSCELISESKGEEAGIKSSTIKISGLNSFGYLKNESGVHRLVRISPFDSNQRRHTSFASVWVYPVIDDKIEIEIVEKDLRIDTYRSSGAGGQHVNTTDSAVRITHLPTKIVVQCQNERSQHKNKDTAMKMLKSRLYELEIQKREESSKSAEESKTDIGWGHQIRSYVLQPYQLVKDNRTGVENTSPDNVLNGEIDEFLESALVKIK